MQDPVPLRDPRILVHVDLDHVKVLAVLGGQCLKDRAYLAAGTAPLRPVLHDDRPGARYYVRVEGGFCDGLEFAHAYWLPFWFVNTCSVRQSSLLPCAQTWTRRRSLHCWLASSASRAPTAASLASAARWISSTERACAGPSSSQISASVKPSCLARRMKARRQRSSSPYSRNPEPRRSGCASRPRRW